MVIWRELAEQDAVAVGLSETNIQLTPWSIQHVRETLEHGGKGWGAWDQHELIAYLVLQPAVDTADILTVGVHPQHQRRGWGRQALQQAQNWAVACEMETLFLEVRVSNTAAVALYEACGFKTLHRRPQYYNVPHQPGTREDAWIMAWHNLTIGKK